MLTLTLIHLTEISNKLFVDFYWKNVKVKFRVDSLGGLDIHSSIQASK